MWTHRDLCPPLVSKLAQIQSQTCANWIFVIVFVQQFYVISPFHIYSCIWFFLGEMQLITTLVHLIDLMWLFFFFFHLFSLDVFLTTLKSCLIYIKKKTFHEKLNLLENKFLCILFGSINKFLPSVWFNNINFNKYYQND